MAPRLAPIGALESQPATFDGVRTEQTRRLTAVGDFRCFAVMSAKYSIAVSHRDAWSNGKTLPSRGRIEVRLLVCPSPVKRQASSVINGLGNEPSIRYGIETVRDRTLVCD